MKVTTPVELILNASRVTSNVPELDTGAPGYYDPAEWLDASSYVEGATVSRVSTHKVYQCIADANNTVVAPEIDILSDTPHWYDIGYTNKWRMFSYENSGSTSRSSNLTVTVTPQIRTSNLALLYMTGCTSAVISATVGGSATTLTNCTYTVIGTGTSVSKPSAVTVTGTSITSILLYDLPPTTTIVYTIVLTGPGVVTCKHCIIGWPEYLGDLQSDITRSDINFSTIDRDTYGTVTLVKRRSVPKLSYSLFTKAAEINRILAIRDDLNATPALWNAMDNNIVPDYTQSLITLGFYRDFSIRLDNPVSSTISLEIEEM
jgi:hypothetical protein